MVIRRTDSATIIQSLQDDITLAQLRTVAIYNLDAAVTPDELLAKLSSQAKVEMNALTVKSLRAGLRNYQTAILSAPEAVALKLIELGRVEIGWAKCRIRELEQWPLRCFKCLSTSHIACWAKDSSGKAALWCCGSSDGVLQDILHGNGFVRARFSSYWLYSCYLAPSLTLEQFGRTVDRIADDVRGRQRVIIGGDFNAWSVEWESSRSDDRGRLLLEAFANLSISLLNVGSQNTFRRAGTGSIVDLSFASDSIAASATWSVGSTYSASDHEVITFTIGDSRHPLPRTQHFLEVFKPETLNPQLYGHNLDDLTFSKNMCAEDSANSVMARLAEACEASMSQSGTYTRHHKTVFWWNDAIAEARRSCFRARRLYQRARRSTNFEALGLEYKRRRNILKTAIRSSKRECFLSLCDSAEHDPWDKAY
ncbi:uncharacterized protein [Drosophila tropicalis]|uniref:uncharacterized protein n=1 Tax=Drosophila tropicalis TaxID=46794 RepID=UPI0035AB9C8E